MKNSANPLRQWFVVRLWRLRCRWAGRRLTPGTRVRVTSDGVFRDATGVIVETNDSLPMWRLVELDRPLWLGGTEHGHVNCDTTSLRRVA